MDRFKHDALDEVWPSGRPPATFSRADRVRLLGEAFQALLAGRLPSREAALFLGGAGTAWLVQGGSLEKDFLQVVGPSGSHFTPSALWERLCEDSSEGAQDPGGGNNIPPSSNEGEP